MGGGIFSEIDFFRRRKKDEDFFCRDGGTGSGDFISFLDLIDCESIVGIAEPREEPKTRRKNPGRCIGASFGRSKLSGETYLEVKTGSENCRMGLGFLDRREAICFDPRRDLNPGMAAGTGFSHGMFSLLVFLLI